MKVRFIRQLALAIITIGSCWAIGCGAPDSSPFLEQGGQGGALVNPSSGQGGAGASGTGTESSNISVGSGGGKSGCAKVDFLFVIDNSVSMQGEQEALIASFPGFISTIKDSIAAKSDYHILVADTDDWGKCDPNNNNCASKGVCKEANAYICNTQFDTCDMTIGAGVVHPAGKGASNKLCPLAGGQRYIQEQEPDLNAAFACIAQVGLAGHAKERPMDSLVAAVSADLNKAGACNEGYLRDDAILVITFITDEAGDDEGSPQDWYDAVVAAKNGDPNAVVVIGLTNGGPNADLVQFVDLWGSHGAHSAVSDDDYTPLFESAVSVIDEACDEFEPPQ